MGIKRCPSFSKRPGFPCGLRVLLVDADNAARSKAENLLKECSYTVTLCSTTAEALTRLTSGNTYDVLLADKSMVSGKTRDRQQLLDVCKGLPCILMAQDPSPQDILTGIQLGAVDFLAKPLSPLKLQNIWQHTVRKMMSNMNINCSGPAPVAAEPAVVAAATTAAVKKELDEMEVIMEEPEAELAAVSDGMKVQNSSKVSETAAADSLSQRAQKVKESVPNAALAAASSFFEPTKCLSRSASLATADSTATVACIPAPDSPAKAAGSQQPKKHTPVHSCPSTRSLNSMASCYSNLQLALPGSPSATEAAEGADELAGQPSSAAAVTPASSPSPCPQQQQRCMKKAVRHPTPATPASKPPLGKPQHSSQQQKTGKGSAVGPCSGATTAGPLPVNIGMTSVPLPTGLGPLPQGMVWGMPMCPLARAPGIVPPKTSAPSSGSTGSCSQQAATAAGSSATAAGVMSMSPMGMPWGMMGMPPMGMPMGMPTPFMAGFVMPPMPMAMPFGPYGGPSMPGFAGQPAAFNPQQMQIAGGVAAPQQDAAAAAAAPVPLDQMPQAGAASTGAAAAAALNASWNADGCMGAAEDPAAGMDLNEAFDFMLGDITAEDDLDVGMSGLLDGELAQLEKDGLKLPTELQELQACQQQEELQQLQQQQQQRASMDCSTLSRHNSSQRISFDCHSHARQRVSFDCSTASTATAGRLSFDCSSANPTSRPAKSQRVSFEVNCPSGKPACNLATASSMTAAQAGKVGSAAIAYEQSADPLLGSMSDLFAACSGDSCSEGSNGMITDLHGLFGPGECGNDEGCSTAAAAAAGLFDDVMDDLPLELAMKKSSSLAELLNAGLPPMHA